MNKQWKRWGALAMALVMALTLFPVSALAARRDDSALPATPAVEREETSVRPAVNESYDAPVSLLATGTPLTDASDATRDIPTRNYTMSACSEISTTDGTEGPVNLAINESSTNYWHSKTKEQDAAVDEDGHHWIKVELDQATWVSALRYRPRTDYTSANPSASASVNGNGYVTSYRVEVSQNGTDWMEADSGSWNAFDSNNIPTGAWEVSNFTPVLAKYIKLVGVQTAGNGNFDNAFMHASQIRVVGMPVGTQTYSVSGTVVDESSQPIDGAVVDILGMASTTNTSGQFTINNLISDTYTITVTKDGYELVSGGTVNVGSANVTNHTIQMRSVQRTISGTVTSGGSGLEGATVTLVRADAPYTTVAGVSTTSGTGGSYTLNVNTVTAGNYKIRAAKAGYGAAIGGTAVNVTTSAADQDFQAQPVALTAIDQSAVDHAFDMTVDAPDHTTGTNTSARVDNGLVMDFNGTTRANNQLKITGIKTAAMTVEFDATRSGSNTAGGFGVALRYADDSNYLYVGQNAAADHWVSESVLAGATTQSTPVQGPSFGTGETRHFKITLRQENSVARVSLWIDGVQVMDSETVGNVGTGVTAQGLLAFLCGVNNTSVTVKNLYISKEDPAYTVTMPETLKGYVVVSGAADSPLKEGRESGTFVASPGDVVNIYSANPVAKQMTAPLTVYETGNNSNSFQVNTLHVTHTNSAHKDRGYYVQFVMPAYNVTLNATLEEMDTKAITSVAILRTTEAAEVVNVGRTVELSATLTPAIGVEDLSVTWSSSDPATVSVSGPARAELDDNGADAAYASATVTGLKAGTATITIRTANGLEDTRQVTVGVAVANVFFQDTTAFTLYTNGTGDKTNTKQLEATVDPGEATNKALTWWSSDPQIATVDQSGLVTAAAAGTATIYVRSQQNPKLQAFRNVTVVTLPKGLTLDVTEAELVTSPGAANYTQVVVPTITPADASDKTISWSVQPSGIVSVSQPWSDSENALLTAQRIGMATVTARSAADNSITATVAVTVRGMIEGDVTIAGAPKYDSQLTVNINEIIEAAKEGLTYQWYRGSEPIKDATDITYTPVLEDIGQVLTVKVTATGNYIGELTCSTGVIEKADGLRMQATPTHRNVSAEGAADGAITGLIKGRKYQYLKWDFDGQPGEDANWIDFWDENGGVEETIPEGQTYGTAAIENLGVGDYLVRRAETETHKAGPVSNTVTIAVETAENYDLINPHYFEGGVVQSRRTQIPAGDTVTLIVTPDKGYELETLTASYTGEDGEKHQLTVTKQDDVTYTFTMPAFAVTVDARFERKVYTIGHNLTNITCNMDEQGGHTAKHGEKFTITLTPDEGYEMPRALSITVTESGQRFTDYTYAAAPDAPEKRVLTFTHGVTQDITIFGAATLKTFLVEYVSERVSFTVAPATAGWHQEFVAAVTPDEGYQLPEEITVTMNGEEVKFDYNKETGAVHIAEGVVEGDLVITVNGVKSVQPLEKISISGIAQVGQRLTANITPANADGYVTYQWYWVDEDGNETAIEGSTGRTKSVSEASLDKMIVVKATAVADSGFSGTVTSQPTGVVIEAGAEEVMPTLVQIVRERVDLEVGGVDTLVAYVAPANATNKTVRWSTSDPSVVTVENGVITGVAPGTATITVATEADETITDTCLITVAEPKVVLAEAADVVVPYDGRAHSIVVAVTSPADGGATISYSSDGINFRSNNPTFSAVGEHVVWYQVAAAGLETFHGQAKVTIEKATPAVEITASPASLSAAGEITLTVVLPDYVDPAALSVEASDPNLTLIRNEDGTYTVSLPGTTKTYTFTAILQGTDNYEDVTATCTVQVGTSSGTGGNTGGNTGGGGTGGGGAGGGGGAAGGGAPGTRRDGAIVTTVTDTVTGTTTETVKQTNGTVSQIVTDADGDVTITVTDETGEEIAKVTLPATIPTPDDTFIDLDPTPWAKDAINHMAGLKLVNGVGGSKYDPTASMTRGSLATVLFRLSQGKTNYAVTFKDVAKGQYYTEGVAWATKAGVVTGYSADTFAPNDTITREQLAVMLARYAKLIGMDTTANKAALDKFTDGARTGGWASDGVAWCVEKGILQGKGANNLDPTAKVTRAEVAVMLDRFIALIK